MNIVVKTYSGKVTFRPDTTWKQGDDAVYFPDFINSVSASPVLFARICKAGRSVSSKFAERYYDAVGYGMLLYPDDLLADGPEGFACASCMDHTSFLSHPLLGKDTLDLSDRGLRIDRDGEEIFRSPAGKAEFIAASIQTASRFCYLRTGDFLVMELAPMMPLASRSDGERQICAYFGDNMVFDFKTVF